MYPVGRLDYNSYGLVLLTNDGDVANALMHPSKKVIKTYIVEVDGFFPPDFLSKFEKEIVYLDEGRHKGDGSVIRFIAEKPID